jgi:hypothetical protein
MSEDKSDKKLPVRYHKTETAPTAVDRVHPPVSNQTLFGRLVSGFVARLNKHTIERNIEEVRAHTDYAKARGEYAETSVEAERKIEHYLKHRDDIIADDHEQHLDQMAANRTARALAREEREYQMELAREKRKQELNKARFASATTQWGLDAFNQSLPHRQERIDHLYKSGALDAQLGAAILSDKVSKVTTKEKPAEAASENHSPVAKALEAIDQQIELAAATHASQDVIDQLTTLRARLSSQIELEKNRRE